MHKCTIPNTYAERERERENKGAEGSGKMPEIERESKIERERIHTGKFTHILAPATYTQNHGEKHLFGRTQFSSLDSQLGQHRRGYRSA